MLSRRRDARIVALQALFEIDIAGHDPETVLMHRFEEKPLSKRHAQYARHLVMGVLTNLKEIDSLISKYAPARPINQLPYIDRNILRIGLYEMIYVPQTPIRAAINEAVELAKCFGSDSSYRFVNGVLGAVYDNERSLIMSHRRKKRVRREK